MLSFQFVTITCRHRAPFYIAVWNLRIRNKIPLTFLSWPVLCCFERKLSSEAFAAILKFSSKPATVSIKWKEPVGSPRFKSWLIS